MKITIDHEGHSVTLQDEAVVDICEAIDLMEKALCEVGYAPERVEGGFLIKAKQINKEI